MDFLSDVKPVLKELLDELLKKYPYASILAQDNYAKDYSVSAQGTVIKENELLTGRGFVVRVFDEEIAEFSFNDISKGTLGMILTKIERNLSQLKANVPGLIHRKKIKVNKLFIEKLDGVDKIEFDKSTPFEIDPRTVKDKDVVKKLTKASEAGRALKYDNANVIDCQVRFNYQCIDKLFLSKNKDLRQHITWTVGAFVTIVERDGKIKTGYKPFSLLGGAEILDKLKEGAKSAIDRAVLLLDAEPITPGTYECITSPAVTGMIVHEAFGHGVEMDMFMKDRALAKHYINKRVASDLITMHDSALASEDPNYNNVATYFFDDEGTLPKDTVIIEKGILKRGMCDLVSAINLNKASTGNGRRESYSRKAYTRMTNTYFEGGTDSVEDMIKSVEYGFLLEDPSNGMEDPKNWGIQCMVNTAREIKDGKLTGKVFSPIVLTGYVPDLLKSVSMLSPFDSLGGSGFCGKGYKEWVKVSDGGPYMKAKITLG